MKGGTVHYGGMLRMSLAVAGAACLMVVPVSALSVSGDSIGTFVNPVQTTNPSMTVTGMGTSQFTWGVGSPPSSLQYDNTPFVAAETETPFTIGTITYFNGAITAGTGADAVDLNLNVSFTDPSGINQSFDYLLQLINTSNVADPLLAADYVILDTFPTSTFTIGLTTYTMTLEFANLNGGGFIQTGNQFHVLEEQPQLRT